MIAYMSMGLAADDIVARNPIKKYEAEFGDASAFLNTAFRSMQTAWAPDQSLRRPGDMLTYATGRENNVDGANRQGL
jgi:hypothetical protein